MKKIKSNCARAYPENAVYIPTLGTAAVLIALDCAASERESGIFFLRNLFFSHCYDKARKREWVTGFRVAQFGAYGKLPVYLSIRLTFNQCPMNLICLPSSLYIST